jgi:hypothetical protein
MKFKQITRFAKKWLWWKFKPTIKGT